MASVNQDFVMYSGDDCALHLVLSDASGEPLDLRDCELRWGMGPLSGAEANVQKTSPSGIEIVDAAKGRATVYLEPADTASLTGTRRHQVTLVDSSGEIETLLEGRVTIRPSSLRPA